MGEDWIKRIILTKDKTIINADMLVDDRPQIQGATIPSWEHIIYDQPYNSLTLDLDNDGELDLTTYQSPERYLVSEKYIKLGEKDYEFVVDRYGRTLTLNPFAKKLPPLQSKADCARSWACKYFPRSSFTRQR